MPLPFPSLPYKPCILKKGKQTNKHHQLLILLLQYHWLLLREFTPWKRLNSERFKDENRQLRERFLLLLFSSSNLKQYIYNMYNAIPWPLIHSLPTMTKRDNALACSSFELSKIRKWEAQTRKPTVLFIFPWNSQAPDGKAIVLFCLEFSNNGTHLPNLTTAIATGQLGKLNPVQVAPTLDHAGE